AVGLLEREQAIRHLPIEVGPLAAHQPVEEDVLRLHRDVRFERRVPVAVRMLLAEALPHRGRDGLADARRARLRALVRIDQHHLPVPPRHAPSLPAVRSAPAGGRAAVPATSTTIVVAPRPRSARATASASSASAMIAPPAPPPVSFAPSAPAPR